jgi:hypothetical protein
MRPKPWPAASSIPPVDTSKLVKRLSALAPRIINNVAFLFCVRPRPPAFLFCVRPRPPAFLFCVRPRPPAFLFCVRPRPPALFCDR